MREFGIKFIFRSKTDNPISESVLYELRSEVAIHLEHCGFGGVVRQEDPVFENRYATPAINDYDPQEQELYLTYNWSWPLRHGNLTTLFTQCVPELESFADRMNVKLTFRSVFF